MALKIRRAVWVMIIVCAAAEPVAAQAPASSDDKRVLAQHRFPVSEFSPTPFTFTSFAMRVGLESNRVPSYPQLATLDPAARARVDLNSLLVAEALDLSVRVHERVAISGSAYGRARVGADRPTLLNVGVDYAYGGNLAALVMLVRTRAFQLSVRGSFGASTGQVAGIGVLFNDLTKIADQAIAQQQSGTLTQQQAVQQLQTAFLAATAELMTPFSTWTASGAVAMAVGFNPYLGLQASVGFSADNASYDLTRYDEATRLLLHYERGVRSLMPAATLALDFDGSPSRVPIDVVLEYQLAPTFARTTLLGTDISQSAVEQLIGFALYYSGRADLQLGITGVWVFGQTPLLGENSQPSGHPHEITGRFVFRYFW